MKKRDKMTAGALTMLASTIILAIAGVIAIVVGYCMEVGIEGVAEWFTSRWAIYIYISIAFAVFVIVWAVHERKMRE